MQYEADVAVASTFYWALWMALDEIKYCGRDSPIQVASKSFETAERTVLASYYCLSVEI